MSPIGSPLSDGAGYNVGIWNDVTLLNGWVLSASSPTIAWCQAGRTIQFRGRADSPAILAGNTVLFTIPANIRLLFPMEFMCSGITVLGAALGCPLSLTTNGNLTLLGITAVDSISLCNLSYSLVS